MDISIQISTREIELYFDNFQFSESTVAFSVYKENTDHLTISAGSILVFDQVIINVGGGYNKVSGAFTAPVHGIYSFTLNFMTLGDSQTGLGIDVNDERLCTAYEASRSGMASCTAITELQKDDVVNVKVVYSAKLHAVGSYWQKQNALVGFLYKAL